MTISTALTRAHWLTTDHASTTAPSHEQLRELLIDIALRAETWAARVRHDRDERWYGLLLRTPAVDVWLIGWWPGQWTPVHDHGGAKGALIVLQGTLIEERVVSTPAPHRQRRSLVAGTATDVDADVVHRVGNAGRTVATSIHAYSPPGIDIRAVPDATADLRTLGVREVAGTRL